MENNNAHTLGKMICEFDTKIYFFLNSENGDTIATIMWEYNGIPKETHKANATRIAEAWNSYDELKEENELLRKKVLYFGSTLERIKVIYDNVEDTAGVIAKEALDKYPL